jgi:hypothetical protein
MMSSRLKRNADTLHYLCYCKNKKAANAIINTANPELINCFSEISSNVLKGNAVLNEAQRNKLKKYKKYIRDIASKSTSQKVKKRILQKGGFIGALLKPLMSVIFPLVSGLFSKKQ